MQWYPQTTGRLLCQRPYRLQWDNQIRVNKTYLLNCKESTCCSLPFKTFFHKDIYFNLIGHRNLTMPSEPSFKAQRNSAQTAFISDQMCRQPTAGLLSTHQSPGHPFLPTKFAGFCSVVGDVQMASESVQRSSVRAEGPPTGRAADGRTGDERGHCDVIVMKPDVILIHYIHELL